MSDKRMSRLSQRFNLPTAPPAAAPVERERVGSPTAPMRRSKKVARARQSLHFADQSMADIDAAYRKAVHDVYPQKLNKAAFIEAMIATGLNHIEETVALALEQSQDEEE
jgi:hypothetical protein